MSQESATTPSRPSVVTTPQPDTVNGPEVKKWTIMFLLAGDGVISSSMISQLKAITDAGFQGNTNVIVYFDPNCNGMNARIFEVNKNRRDYFIKAHGKATSIGDGENPYVRNIEEDCHGARMPQIPAPTSLRFFLEYTRTYHPAENYIVFLMGHGVVVGNDAFLPDTDDNSAITLPQLGKELRDFSDRVRADNAEFHLLGLHSCSMNSVEVAYELQDTARYMIGAQGSAFPGSWPYRHLLKKMFATIERYEKEPVPESKDYPNPMVREILDGLQDLSFYNSVDFWLAGYSSDISMFSLDKDKINALDSALEGLACALKEGLKDPITKGQILRAHLESQSYWNENYTDLYDFCYLLKKYIDESRLCSSIPRDCDEVMRKLRRPQRRKRGNRKGDYDRLVVYSDYFGPAYQHSNGLSVYFPWRAPEPKILEMYAKYAFHDRAGAWWLDFLIEYFNSTRRQARSVYKPLEKTRRRVPTVMPLTTEEWLKKPASELVKIYTDGALDPGGSDKSSGEMDISPGDKSSGEMDTSPGDKSSGEMDTSPGDKSSGEMDTSPGDKSSGEMDTPPPGDKSGSEMDMIEPSDKSGGEVGIFGRAVIKNFENPKQFWVTSRPNGHPWDRPPERNKNGQRPVTK
jgi:Clostripain family